MSHAFSYRQPSPYIPVQCDARQCLVEFFCHAQSNGRDFVKQLSYVTAKVISHHPVTRFVLVNKRLLITLFRSFFTDSKMNNKSGPVSKFEGALDN